MVHSIGVKDRFLDCAGSTEDQIGTGPVIIRYPPSKRLAYAVRRIVFLVAGRLDRNPGSVIGHQPIKLPIDIRERHWVEESHGDKRVALVLGKPPQDTHLLVVLARFEEICKVGRDEGLVDGGAVDGRGEDPLVFRIFEEHR